MRKKPAPIANQGDAKAQTVLASLLHHWLGVAHKPKKSIWDARIYTAAKPGYKLALASLKQQFAAYVLQRKQRKVECQEEGAGSQANLRGEKLMIRVPTNTEQYNIHGDMPLFTTTSVIV